MSDAHGAGLPNDTSLNTLGVATAIGLTVVTVPLLILGVYGYFNMISAQQMESKVMSAPTVEVSEARASWAAERDSYGVVEAQSERYRIPVESAKSAIIAEARVKREQGIEAARVAAEQAQLQMLEGAEPAPEMATEGSGQ